MLITTNEAGVAFWHHSIPPESAFPLHLPLPIFLGTVLALTVFFAWFIRKYIRTK